MNALLGFRSFLLVSSLAIVSLGLFPAPTRATHPFGNVYYRDRVVFGNTLQFYPTTTVYPRFYRTKYFVPTYHRCLTPVRYPVSLYDSFGRPYVVHQTSYTTLLR